MKHCRGVLKARFHSITQHSPARNPASVYSQGISISFPSHLPSPTFLSAYSNFRYRMGAYWSEKYKNTLYHKNLLSHSIFLQHQSNSRTAYRTQTTSNLSNNVSQCHEAKYEAGEPECPPLSKSHEAKAGRPHSNITVGKKHLQRPSKRARREVIVPPSAYSNPPRLEDLVMKQEFDFSRSSERSYFVIFESLSGMTAKVGKVSRSTEIAEVMLYLRPGLKLPQSRQKNAFHSRTLLFYYKDRCFNEAGLENLDEYTLEHYTRATGTFADVSAFSELVMNIEKLTSVTKLRLEKDGSNGDAGVVVVHYPTWA